MPHAYAQPGAGTHIIALVVGSSTMPMAFAAGRSNEMD